VNESAASELCHVPIDLNDYLRDWTRPSSWRGISVTDRDILRAHVERDAALRRFTLYTGVPCGHVPAELVRAEQESHLKGNAASWCHSIDALLLDFTDPDNIDGLVVELKPSAGYVAFGQVLHYHHCFMEQHTWARKLRRMILTDAGNPDLLSLAKRFGVIVLELPGKVYTPTGHAT
jgi:hypothetical protein